MLICPDCNTALNKNSNSLGLFWACPECDGRAISIEVVRKAVPMPIVNKLWQRARSGQYVAERRCPACKRIMHEVPIIEGDETKYFDVCTGCFFIWFDPGEFEGLAKIPIAKSLEEQLPLETKRALTLAKLELVKEGQDSETMGFSSPDHLWEIVPALFGMPIVYKQTGLKQKPIVTWSLSILIAAISIIAFFNLKETVANWGLIPAEFGRYLGLTFISSFFLHGGILHLVGNLYFLLVFGSNTEDVLGKERYLLLIITAAIIGNAAHILGNLNSTIPCIGASGGISGILAYFCLRFPKARVGVILLFRWFRMPVGFMFVMWVLYQFLYAYMQTAGLSGVSGLAHLGGAAVGAAFWWKTRKSSYKKPKEPVIRLETL
jgi:membrane associated rhomboid family serine protease/Zn-finger nucleic acid-binding protein